MWGAVVKARHAFVVFGVLAALAIPTGCNGDALASDAGNGSPDDGPSIAEQTAEDQKTENSPSGEESTEPGRRAADAVIAVEDEDAWTGGVVVGTKDGEKNEPSLTDAGEIAEKVSRRGKKAAGDDSSGRVMLKIKGEDGVPFSGNCSVGGKERQIGGNVPTGYAFEPGGQKLACEVRREGPGALKVVLEAGDRVRSSQQSGGSGGKIGLTYSEDRISMSQSSSGSGGQVQSSSISDLSSRNANARQE
ncbi:MAG: hypothetical protein AVDCRST_MAG22-3584 [uncultured Rubrobacteraceae bacterium]|uniref:Lipoprotein n=1 Tax=uncultured Rubrobacteraceae bacterium TaxID=349277 RepID=A0A6J4Q6M3_9ACTN|nr:MAG: hypothetical protein AVDCRST_MAG22-3584 [uncultured Rubrobacteraceae bacterium]